MARAAKRHRFARTLKIKVNNDDPVACIQAVRAVAPASKLIVDPNESWSFVDLEAVMPNLVELSVDLIEQPLPANDDTRLAEFCSPIPIAADEAVHGVESLDQVAQRYQVINIKLDKTGGLTAALQLAKEGRARGLELMLGCMVSSSLSIAPAAHLAASARFIDLDGSLNLSTDRDYPVNISDEGTLAFSDRSQLWGGVYPFGAPTA